jgi:peptidyl-prolyl cis-trans isomerase B (cyclophilin B)
MLAFLILACDRVETEPAASDPATPHQGDLGAETPFVWPDDPSHPVLEIEIASPNSTGSVLIELMPEIAPATVIQVIELANDGFYDGTTFHRVIPGFMIQGGDPNSRDRDPANDGHGQPGRALHDEFGDAPFVRGVVGMGNKGRQNSTSTQFFIMQADNPNLDGRYTAVGRVVSGMDIVDDVTRVEIDRSGRWGPKDRPLENVVMTRVRTVGQVAAVRAALELEVESKDLVQHAGEPHTPRLEAPIERRASASSSPPAAPNPNDTWERLEAGQQ